MLTVPLNPDCQFFFPARDPQNSGNNAPTFETGPGLKCHQSISGVLLNKMCMNGPCRRGLNGIYPSEQQFLQLHQTRCKILLEKQYLKKGFSA